MALKTFNVDAEIYEEFSKHCKKEGLSMSKKVEKFIKSELEKMKIDVDKLEEAEKRVEKKLEEHPLSKYC